MKFQSRTSIQEIARKHLSPHVAVVGNPFSEQYQGFLVADGVVILSDIDLIDSLGAVIGVYFITDCEYPKDFKTSLIYLQAEVFKIALNGRVPSKVISFVQKLTSKHQA